MRLKKKIPIAPTLLLIFLIATVEIPLYAAPMGSADARAQGFTNLIKLSLFQSSSQCIGSGKSALSDCLHVLTSLNKIRIAVVKPVFTAAAYDGYPEKSFYGFYKKYSNVPEKTIVKTDLNLLDTSVKKDAWGYSYGLYSFVKSDVAKDAGIIVENNTSILTDIDVNDGALFSSTNGSRRFDVVILGFTEYVTAKEYSNYKRFVEIGGRLIFLSACNFVAEVSYNSATNKLRLVKGHGWVFNGTAASKGSFHRWYVENTNWIGSNYALFHTAGYHIDGAIASTDHPLAVLMRKAFGKSILFSYNPHEENAVTNSSDRVIAFWQVSHLKRYNLTVAVYEHDYMGGTVIHTGIFGTDIIGTDKELQFLLLASIGFKSSTQNKITAATEILPFSSSLSQAAAPTDKHNASCGPSERKVQTPNRLPAMTIKRSIEKADPPILAGYTILQNYIGPHLVLESKTPAYATSMVAEEEDTWLT